MTIAEVNVNLYLALPQGWTKAEVEERINDLLVAAMEREHDNGIVEFEVVDTRVNADPFGKEFQQKVNTHFTGRDPSLTAANQFNPNAVLYPFPTKVPLALR